MKIVKAGLHRFGRWYINRICSSESSSQSFTRHNERTIEFGFALRALAKARPRTVLDVGTGTTAWPHLLSDCGYVVTAIDNVRDYWPAGMFNRHWTVQDVDIVNPNDLTDAWDAITCISVLEHIHNHVAAVRNMRDRLTSNGILILTTPYSERNPYPNVYDHPQVVYGHGLPYICRSSSRAELEQWLGTGLRLECRELWKLFTGPVWDTGEDAPWEKVEAAQETHQLGCFVFRRA